MPFGQAHENFFDEVTLERNANGDGMFVAARSLNDAALTGCEGRPIRANKRFVAKLDSAGLCQWVRMFSPPNGADNPQGFATPEDVPSLASMKQDKGRLWVLVSHTLPFQVDGVDGNGASSTPEGETMTLLSFAAEEGNVREALRLTSPTAFAASFDVLTAPINQDEQLTVMTSKPALNGNESFAAVEVRAPTGDEILDTLTGNGPLFEALDRNGVLINLSTTPAPSELLSARAIDIVNYPSGHIRVFEYELGIIENQNAPLRGFVYIISAGTYVAFGGITAPRFNTSDNYLVMGADIEALGYEVFEASNVDPTFFDTRSGVFAMSIELNDPDGNGTPFELSAPTHFVGNGLSVLSVDNFERGGVAIGVRAEQNESVLIDGVDVPLNQSEEYFFADRRGTGFQEPIAMSAFVSGSLFQVFEGEGEAKLFLGGAHTGGDLELQGRPLDGLENDVPYRFFGSLTLP